MAVKTMIEAIRDGLREEMESDDRVFVMGEDVGPRGGVFGVTDGFFKQFGAERVLDTPLPPSTACVRWPRCSSPTSATLPWTRS